MPLVVFLRGVNVGGHMAFQPSALANELVALILLRRLGRRVVYPNEVIEKKLGVSATTRN